MSQVINTEIDKAIDRAKKVLDKDLSKEHALIYVTLDNVLYDGDGSHYVEIDSMITDGSNDGGIDFVYYDDEKPAVIVGQSKHSKNIMYNDVINELRKMIDTVNSFKNGHASAFNQKVQSNLQEAFDTLPDDSKGSVEYYFITTATLENSGLKRAIKNKITNFDFDTLTVLQEEDISDEITSNMETIHIVPEDYVLIDDTNNYLEYEPVNGRRGLIVNVSSKSIERLYRLYIDKGLFSLNIRGFVGNRRIDDGITNTLNGDREDFWFYNNGLTIACSDFRQDGKRIKMTDFSIVNGGQTTTLIGKYNGSNTNEFFLPCKIVARSENEGTDEFFTKIAETTNSQKPIKPRDLKSNSPEMHRLQRWLGDKGIFLEIKRGDKRGKEKKYLLNNEVWAQLMLSFVYQQPGTARSGKKAIWENKETYNKLFVQPYHNDIKWQEFILDLIDLYKRYSELEKDLRVGQTLKPVEKDALKNGKMAVFALFGILYGIVNGDFQKDELRGNIGLLETHSFNYGAFLSNYHGDDIDSLIESLISDMATVIAEVYEACSEKGNCTSISNLLKTDKKYREEIVDYLLLLLNKSFGSGILENAKKLFSRK